MLYPAQLYKEELKQRLISCWYKPKYKFYFGDEYNEFEVPAHSNGRRDFVHLDEQGHVDGYFSYWYNKVAKSLNNFGLISFTNNGFPLIRDAEAHVVELMNNNEVRRLEFWAFEDNPVNNLYKRFMKKYDGKIAGYLRDTEWFDGKYHNTIIYEIIKK